jgi:hypothetical protein
MEIYGAYRSNVARIRDAITENKVRFLCRLSLHKIGDDQRLLACSNELNVIVAVPQTQMRQVNQSLGMFQSGLLCVEREMLPIYKLTERLRETQKNIDLCVQELRKINENFIAAHEVRSCEIVCI